MSSPKQFGQSVLKAGTGALMSKMDMKDAYKNVPAKVKDLQLQGFSWLGAYFVETQLIFGAYPAVANFDNLGGTTENITLTHCSIPEDLVHRILDDTVCVAPAGTGWCQEFSETYKRICHQLNIKLAEECPRQEKAFTNKTRGTILRIQFDTNKLAWRISEDKISEILSDIHTLIHGGHADLEQMERVAGRLNNFGQMCPFKPSGLQAPSEQPAGLVQRGLLYPEGNLSGPHQRSQGVGRSGQLRQPLDAHPH